VPHATFKLVEQLTGTGQLVHEETVLGDVRYTIARYQGMFEGNGMPIPEDGRALRVMLAARDGRLFSEGHGPSRCTCC